MEKMVDKVGENRASIRDAISPLYLKKTWWGRVHVSRHGMGFI